LALSAEWRADGKVETVLVIDGDDNTVRKALAASPSILSQFLTDMGDLHTWQDGQTVAEDKRSPESWGRLVLSRAETGEVIDMDPEKFWDCIYVWFRSRGVDYTTHGQ